MEIKEMIEDITFMKKIDKCNASDIAEKFYKYSCNKPLYIKKDILQKIRKIYKKYSLDIVANQLSKLIYDCSLISSRVDKKKNLEEIKILFSAFQTEDIAENYCRMIFNEINDEDKISLKKAKKVYDKIESIYSKFKTLYIAEALSKICYFLWLRVRKNKEKYQKIIFKLYNEYEDVGVYEAYSYVLFDEKFHCLDKDKLIKEFLTKEYSFEVFSCYYNSAYYPKYNKFLKKVKFAELYPCVELGKRINKIIKEINKNDESGDVIALILGLLSESLELKNELAVSVLKDDIGHYTKNECLPEILNSKVLRIYNSSYMNDPLEGMTLVNNLADNIDIQSKKIYDTDNLNEDSNIYLSCFTTSIDELPMWSMYGDDGKGCCLIMNKIFFDGLENTDVIDDSAIICGHNIEANPNYLYRVCYLDGEDITVSILTGENENKAYDIAEKISNISSILKELNDNEYLSRKEVVKAIRFILDQIRFLFKDVSYEHENELRIMTYSENPIVDEKAHPFPKLFVSLDNPLKYNKLILGPKVQNINVITPYINFINRVEKIEKSVIKYR